MQFVLWLTDRDGEDVGFRLFDNEDELLSSYPFAEKEEDRTYTSWIGGHA